MNKVLIIAFNDLRIYFSQWGNLVGLILIPIILATVLGLTSIPPEPKFTIDVVDLDNTATSHQFIAEMLASNGEFHRSEEEQDVELAKLRIAEETIDALIIIPSGFDKAVKDFDILAIPYYSNEDVLGGTIQQSLNTVISHWNSAIIATRAGEIVASDLSAEVNTNDIYNRSQAFIAQEQVSYDVSLTGAERELQPGEGFGQSIPGFGAMFVMFTVFGGMATLLRERQNWTMQRMIVMPLTRAHILSGKILTYFTLGMIQFSILFGFGALMGLQMQTNLVALLLIMSSYTLAITALSFALASSIRSEGQANNLTTLLSISLAALGGAWWSLEFVPPFLQTIGHLSPVAWAMDAFNFLIYFDGGLVDILPHSLILLILTGILFIISVQRFKYD